VINSTKKIYQTLITAENDALKDETGPTAASSAAYKPMGQTWNIFSLEQ
jgi:hypothetical protein